MKNIGAIPQNSTILLEIITKDRAGNPLSVDYPVTAKIERQSADGLQVLDNVTLITAGNVGIHQKEYKLPASTPAGEYIITYHVSVQGKSIQKREKFVIADFSPMQAISLDSSEETEDTYGEHPAFVMPPDFQTPVELEVEGEKVHLQLNEGVKRNSTYQVIITDELKSISGSSLGELTQIEFTSAYAPLYATPLEVRSVLKDIFFYFQVKDIYEAIRDAGQKVHQLLRLPANADEAGFALLQSNEDTYFPAKKVSIYQASNQLINQLIIKMLYPNDASGEDNSGVVIDTSTDSFVLGDFQVTKKGSAEESFGSSSGEPVQITALQRLIEANEKELKFWTDALLGRNARGYSSPISATSRGSVTVPGSRDI